MVFEDLFMGMKKMVPLYTVKRTARNYDGAQEGNTHSTDFQPFTMLHQHAQIRSIALYTLCHIFFSTCLTR